MTSIIVNPNLPIEVALKKFKKAVEEAGILKELRRREHYVKPSVTKKLKSLEARKLSKKRDR